MNLIKHKMIIKNKVLNGIVVSKKNDKTVVVLISKIVKHKLYGKYYKKNFKFHVHDEHNICKVNDLIEIKEGRPVSKTKFWYFNKFLNR